MPKKKKAPSPTTADMRIFLWDLTGSEDGPFVAKAFRDERETVEWLASSPNPFSRKPASPKYVMEDLNVTWKDGGTFVDFNGRRSAWTRRWAFTRADGAVWNPKDREEKIDAARRAMEAKKPRPRRWNEAYLESLGWKGEKGVPVPHTGKKARGFKSCRRPRYVRARRLDYTRDGAPPVRKKAIPPDPWETEPFEDAPRCWKDQSKRRRQAKERER